MERCVKIDGKVRTDHNYPVGFMDVISLEKSGRGRLQAMPYPKGIHVRQEGSRGRHPRCGSTLRFPDPNVAVNDTVKVDIATRKMSDIYKFEIGAMVMITLAVTTRVALEPWSTWRSTMDPSRLLPSRIVRVTLPKGRGIKKTILQERAEAEARGDL
eukprot:scaffold14131_cov89-Cyclotella_meneghiniana.AAC.1